MALMTRVTLVDAVVYRSRRYRASRLRNREVPELLRYPARDSDRTLLCPCAVCRHGIKLPRFRVFAKGASSGN